MNKLILFDFDGTIADSMWAWDELGRDTLCENSIPVFADYEDVIRTMSVPDFSVYMSKRYPELGSSTEIMKAWHQKMVFNYLNRVSLKAGIIEFLEYLKKKKYTLYLASATHYDVLIQALRHFDLVKYFDFIITEEKVGISKRDPKIYQMCMEKASVDAEEVYIFEDAVHAVVTAADLGFNVCAIDDYSMRAFREEIKAKASMWLPDFTDLKALSKFIKE